MDLSAADLQVFYNTVYYITFNLGMALTAFLQRDSFLYWPFLVSTLAIALLVGRAWRGASRDYFRAALWWHRSARADYALYFANVLVLPALFGVLLFNEHQLAGWIDAALGWGSEKPPARDSISGVGWRLLFTIAFFVAYDFGRFVAHSLLHDVALLWEFHKVHHSAEVLTPMTSYRAHPVELVLMAWGPAAATGVVTWLFNRLADGAVTFYSFLGLHAVMWAFNLIGNLRHSPVWLSYGPDVGLWLISPAHHQLHHSCEPRHLGCNRGFELAVWDRLYGTLYVPPVKAESFRMGLGDETDGQWHRIWRMYFWPFAAAGRRLTGWLRR